VNLLKLEYPTGKKIKKEEIWKGEGKISKSKGKTKN